MLGNLRKWSKFLFKLLILKSKEREKNLKKNVVLCKEIYILICRVVIDIGVSSDSIYCYYFLVSYMC